MKQPVAYIIGNILWIAIGDSWESDVSLKYMMASWTSGIYNNQIWTQQEIINKYPNAKPVDSLINIKDIYNLTSCSKNT